MKNAIAALSLTGRISLICAGSATKPSLSLSLALAASAMNHADRTAIKNYPKISKVKEQGISPFVSSGEETMSLTEFFSDNPDFG